MFNFSKRINGITYYFRLAIVVIVTLLLAVGVNMVPDNYVIIVVILLLGVMLYLLCLTRQRANDIGWHPLVLTLLVFWTPLLLVLGLFPGQSGSNMYGPAPPKGLSK